MIDKIDVRVLKLNKWYIPKTFQENENEKYIAVGYFDTIQCRGIQIDQRVRHPFQGGYQLMADWKAKEKQALVDYSSQEQLLFTNLCKNDDEEDGTCFSEDKVKQFWEEVDSPYLFLSMIHIDHHPGNLENILKRIKEEFKKDFLSYISFDYCDIYVFVKKMFIAKFLERINNLYELEYEVQDKKKRAVVDTFSMVSFDMDYFRAEKNKTDGFQNEIFQATINLSVRDYHGFVKWYEKVEAELEKYKKKQYIRQYKMYGRHDISIVYEKANNQWLSDIMHNFREDTSKLFWTLETFIKVDPEVTEQIPKMNNDDSEEAYCSASSQLENRIQKLREAVEAQQLRNGCDLVLPFCEVRDCICSILKNTFAEEFVYCIYESFRHLIEYVTEEIVHLDDCEAPEKHVEELAVLYDKYFTALNTLVNSTMHGERQFIQATAFNAIFYTVPPKIMAFYNAYIYRIKEILTDEGCDGKYTFLIYPSFSSVMSVKSIMSEEKISRDRIITIKISERILYDVMDVSHRMVHELAHYIGTDIRCRRGRKRRILYTFADFLLRNLEMEDLDTKRFLKRCVDEIELAPGRIDENIYMVHIRELGGELFELLRYDMNGEVRRKIEEVYLGGREDKGDEMLSTLGIQEIEDQKLYIQYYAEQFCEQKSRAIREQFCQMSEEGIHTYSLNIDLMFETYRESYADLQMILILGVKPEMYLKMFYMKNDVRLEELFLTHEDYLRVCSIFKVMTDCGIWALSEIADEQMRQMMELLLLDTDTKFKGIEDFWKEGTQEVLLRARQQVDAYRLFAGSVCPIKEESTRKTETCGPEVLVQRIISKMSQYDVTLYMLYEYLMEVMAESLAEYQQEGKKKLISQVRGIIRQILDFDSIVGVYNCIESEIYRYKGILF